MRSVRPLPTPEISPPIIAEVRMSSDNSECCGIGTTLKKNAIVVMHTKLLNEKNFPSVRNAMTIKGTLIA